jgi:phage shock protein C
MEKKMKRSMDKRVFAGVAAGLAEYLDLDPVIVRLIFVLLALAKLPLALALYGLLWLIMPEEIVADEIQISKT